MESDSPLSLDRALTVELEELSKQSLRRSLRRIEGAQGARITCQGHVLWNFSSNDYLGLAADPILLEPVRRGLEGNGLGSGASRLISGSLAAHSHLETSLAKIKGTE